MVEPCGTSGTCEYGQICPISITKPIVEQVEQVELEHHKNPLWNRWNRCNSATCGGTGGTSGTCEYEQISTISIT